MRAKPFTPKIHCLVDYAFAAIQIAVPVLLKLNQKTTRRSQLAGASVLVLNSLTQSPVAVKPLVPFKTHGRIDRWTLGALALATFSKDVRSEKKALAYHLGFLAIATMNVLLTDWDADTKR